MGKLTVESIINIYGSGVKEIKTYNEAKRAKTEENRKKRYLHLRR